MNKYLCINKSGESIPVYDYDGNQIGEIYSDEAYISLGGEGGLWYIDFLSNSGFKSGEVHNAPDAFFIYCTDYPYGEEQIDGSNYYTFYMRSSKSVYDANGAYWGKVAANQRVACMTALCGDSKHYLKAINYVERTDGTWVRVITDDDHKYGYVDTGIRSASGWDKIAFYGSW